MKSGIYGHTQAMAATCVSLAAAMVTPAGKPTAVALLIAAHGISDRRACKPVGCCRMTIRYQMTRPRCTDVRQRMREIAQSAVALA